MNKIKFDLEYCHGINKLGHEFNFTKNNSSLIYAPNGTMKTSFTKTLLDLKKGIDSKDNIFTDRVSKRNILKSDGNSLLANELLVVESFKDNYESEKMTTLLVSKELKKEYDTINKSIDSKKNELLKLLSKISGVSARTIEEQISGDLTQGNNKFLQGLDSIYETNGLDEIDNFAYLKYSTIINDKVKVFLEAKDVKKLLEEYIEKYNELMENSTLFKKGVFNHTNANTISKQLDDNGFFNAKYKLIMSDDNIVNSRKELDDLISTAKNEILADEALSSKFDKIDKLIIKNQALTGLRGILEQNQELIKELYDYNNFKQKIWKSYLKYDKDINSSYVALLQLYNNSKEKIKEILKKAREERTKWDNVVSIFNNRFDVPFIVEIENQEDVILKESTPTLVFKYKDNDGVSEKSVSRSELLNVLSQGEKRAFYIMSVVFEIEGIKEEETKTLVIFDDIADSFDYKNKYAIVEYLKDVKEEKNIFNMIILTHNFDFYRTVGKRLNARCLMTTKSESEIKIENGKYTKDIFNQWKNKFYNNDRILIASIPFIRNISDYLKGNDSDEYMCLTHLLHIKSDTNQIKVSKLEEIYKELWRTEKTIDNNERYVLDIIFEQADEICSESTESLNLENKIVLSMAIRLKAETYMLDRIKKYINNDASFEEFKNNIKGNQTAVLLEEFKKMYTNDYHTIKKLDQVNLMTSENIHVNSFMYEPLLDLSENHLKSLYNQMQNLLDDETVDEDQVGLEVAETSEIQ